MPEDQSPPTAQETVETDGAKYLIRLNGPQNVVMRFEDIGADPEDALFVWGFASIAEYRRFLKMLTRFDEALGVQPVTGHPADQRPVPLADKALRMQDYFDALYDALGEVILNTLDGLTNDKGEIQADPRAATDEIMAKVRRG